MLLCPQVPQSSTRRPLLRSGSFVLGARLPGTTALFARRCRSLPARGISNLPSQPPKGREEGEKKLSSTLLGGFSDQWWVDIITSPSPSVVRGRFGSFKPSQAQPIWRPIPVGLNQGGSVPFGASQFLHRVSCQRALPVFDSSSR